MKKTAFTLNCSILLMITVICILTTLAQGIPSLAATARDSKMTVFICLFLLSFVLLLYLWKKEALTEERMVFFIIFLAMLLHCSYVILSGLYDRQHDEGVYTGIASAQINPGHIGYIEYIYKFRQLPDFNPYRLFSYYHPPLHYVLSGLFLILLTALGMPETLAFENLQVLPLFYSGLFMLIAFHILKKNGAHGKALYAGLLLCAMHPAAVIMSGSINNDMLSSLLLSCTILSTLCYLQKKTLKNLLLIALSIGFGMLCKLNTALIAFPVGLILLLDLIAAIRSRNKKSIGSLILNYFLFGVTSAVTGLSFIVRNLIRFHVKPGISSATETSVMYTGSYGLWSRLGIPSLTDWHFLFPFHSLNGDYNHNIWIIMFQTSLFAEEYPTELHGTLLFLCRMAYVSAILFGIASALLFLAAMIRKYRNGNNRQEAVFLLTGYLTFMAGFIVFSVKYPYTCSSDFRYIIICLVYIATGLSAPFPYSEREKGSISACAARVIRAGTCLTLLLMAVIYMTWRRW